MTTPENVECRTCGGSGEVARTVALPGHALAATVTRYDACPDCTPENVDSPRWCETCGHYTDHHTDRHPENVETPNG